MDSGWFIGLTTSQACVTIILLQVVDQSFSCSWVAQQLGHFTSTDYYGLLHIIDRVALLWVEGSSVRHRLDRLASMQQLLEFCCKVSFTLRSSSWMDYRFDLTNTSCHSLVANYESSCATLHRWLIGPTTSQAWYTTVLLQITNKIVFLFMCGQWSWRPHHHGLSWSCWK